MNRRLAAVEVVEDRAESVGPRDGFLELRRLTVRNVYADGSRSADYPCDIVSRKNVDAVTIVLYERRADSVLVGLRENLRVPIWLRRHAPNVPFPDQPRLDTMLETVAGVIEPGDAIAARAVAEAMEEVGVAVTETGVVSLGSASFPSPGITDEKVWFCAAEVDLAAAEPPRGDGSTMEEVGGLVVLGLGEAIERCRAGRIADMKTEIALVRLREHLGG